MKLGPALKTLEDLINKGETETVNFAFIDANETNYPHYYELCLKLIKKVGVIAIDNVLWGG